MHRTLSTALIGTVSAVLLVACSSTSSDSGQPIGQQSTQTPGDAKCTAYTDANPSREEFVTGMRDQYIAEMGAPGSPSLPADQLEQSTKTYEQLLDQTSYPDAPNMGTLLKNVPAGGAKTFTEWYCGKVETDPKFTDGTAALPHSNTILPAQALLYGLSQCLVSIHRSGAGITPPPVASAEEETAKAIEAQARQDLCPSVN